MILVVEERIAHIYHTRLFIVYTKCLQVDRESEVPIWLSLTLALILASLFSAASSFVRLNRCAHLSLSLIAFVLSVYEDLTEYETLYTKTCKNWTNGEILHSKRTTILCSLVSTLPDLFEKRGRLVSWQKLAWRHEREAVNNRRFRISPPTSVYHTSRILLHSLEYISSELERLKVWLVHAHFSHLATLDTGYVTHVTLETRLLLIFRRATLKNWEEPGDKAVQNVRTILQVWGSHRLAPIIYLAHVYMVARL